MWFLLAFSALTLLCSARFALRPHVSRLRLALALGFATLFTMLTSLCTAVAMVGHQLPAYLARHPRERFADALLQGIAESMSPAILGFTVLTLAALFVGLGCYRESIDA